jgi:hypothetical protein
VIVATPHPGYPAGRVAADHRTGGLRTRARTTGPPAGDRSWSPHLEDDLTPRCYREIRSARFPAGFPDRDDMTVVDAFADAWLLIEHSASGPRLVGMAEDYDAARAWLAQDIEDVEEP